MNQIKYRNYQGILVSDANDIIEWVKKYVDEHGGSSVWGNIVGQIENQTDLVQYVAEHTVHAKWGEITGSILDQSDLEAILRGLRNQINVLGETKADNEALAAETQAREEADRLINEYIVQIAHDIEDIETNKQNKTDNDLQTTSKTIVGAINEINANVSGKNEIIVIQNTYTTRTATLNNLAKDEDGRPILQVNIGYKSSMSNHSEHHLDIIFNHTGNSIVAVYTNGIDFNTNYYYHAEWNSSINKFVIAVRKTDEASDTRDIYVEFSEDGNSATITFAKTYVNYIVGSNKL